MAVLLTLALGVALALLAVVSGAAFLGAVGALSGGTFERCDRCHRIGLTAGGFVHRSGCPTAAGRLVPAVEAVRVSRLPVRRARD